MSRLNRTTRMRVGGLCGVTAPIVFFTLIILAVSYAPWFSWTKNALSDLGIQGVSAVLFNFSLIIGGLVTVMFAIGLREILPNRILSQIGSLLLVIAGFDLCAIGVFTEAAGEIHYFVSITFFTALPISMFFIGTSAIVKSPRRNLGLFTILAGVAASLVWTLSWEGAAIPETIASIAASSWSMVSGITLFKETLHS